MKSKNKKQIKSCRVCGGKSLSPAFVIDDIPCAPEKRTLLSSKRSAEFLLCDGTHDPHACGLIQSTRTLNKDHMPVPSGVSRLSRSSLRSAATEALELISGRDCAALDIGCSDGTLLSYYPRWVERFGIDQQPSVDEVGDWAWTACGTFPSSEIDAALGDKKFDIVSALSILEEIEEPRAFLARIKSLMTDDGVLVLETLYAPMTLTRVGVDGIANGASSLYSLGVLERLLRDCDMKIFRGSLTEKNGGSIRVFATHAHVEEYDFDPWFERLARLWDEENALCLRSSQPYRAFEARADQVRESYRELIAGYSNRGASVHLLGTDGIAELLFEWAGEGSSSIEGAVDFARLDDRQRLCPKGPPIINEIECRELKPDALIVPHSLKRDALEVWRDDIMQGLTLIIFGPTPTLVNAGNHAIELGKALSDQQSSGGDTNTLRSILSAAGGLRLVSDRTEELKAAG